MKKILIRRAKENFNKSISYQVVFDDGQKLFLENGETKTALVNITPQMVYARLNWYRSRKITIDESTSELILKAEKIKSWFAPRIFAFIILITLVPRLIWEDEPFVKPVTIIGLSIMLGWTIYAFIIKSNDWILIEKK